MRAMRCNGKSASSDGSPDGVGRLAVSDERREMGGDGEAHAVPEVRGMKRDPAGLLLRDLLQRWSRRRQQDLELPDRRKVSMQRERQKSLSDVCSQIKS